MTNIVENSTWESGVYQLETDDPVLGGPPAFDAGLPVTGHANAQAQQLANRTKYLKEQQEALVSDLADSTDPSKGSSLIGYSGRRVYDHIKDQCVNPRDFGAVGDGIVRLLSSKYTTLAEAQAVYPFATSLSDTIDWAGVQAAFNYAELNKYPCVKTPQGRFMLNRPITVTGYVSILGMGRGFSISSGTIFERPEGTGSTSPMFTIGSGNSFPNFTASDFSLVGDSTVRHAGLSFNVTGLHKPVIERISINYVRGTPIYISTTSSVARPEFISFRDINVGFDFSGYGGRNPLNAAPDDPDCTGIWIRDISETDAGTADVINVDNCVFLGKSNGFNSAITVHARGDVLNINGTSLAGVKYGVDAWTREVNFNSGYLEGLEFCFALRNNFSDSTKGVKIFALTASLVSSCRYTLFADDNAATLNHSTKCDLSDIFVYTNYTKWPEGHDVVYEVGPLSYVEVGKLSSNFANEGAAGLRVIRSAMTNKSRVFGQLSLLRDSLRFSAEAIKFPSSQIASTDPNTLDDYEEGTWIPEITAATPGDLDVSYTSRSGRYTKIGNMVVIKGSLITSNFTYTTASGFLKITGLPFTVSAGSVAPVQASGITYTGTDLMLQGISANPELFFRRSGSGVSIDYVYVTSVTSGATVNLNFTIVALVD